jgi:geranylgeranyl pyrophosphate synthase
MRYACLGPGKRFRPLLCLAAAEFAGGPAQHALDIACAVEMVHAFSLIHDDLPAIDNDDLRRGRPTCHRAFDEATAILAGDGLFALAFAVTAAGTGARGCAILAEAALKLVRGEAQDIYAEGHPTDEAGLEFIHRHKTGALLSAACQLGALSAGATSEVQSKLAEFGETLGLAFQIADDLLNESGDAAALGKSVGSDRDRGKATYPRILGTQAAQARAEALYQHSLGLLDAVPGDSEPLKRLAALAIRRDR